MKRDFRKDHMLRRSARELRPKDSLAEITEGAGRPLYSKALGQLMTPEPAKSIDPNSEEGKAIAARFYQK